MREVEEETRYIAEVVEKMKVKKMRYDKWGLFAEVHYFYVKIMGENRHIQDPDQLIYDIDWKTRNEIKT